MIVKARAPIRSVPVRAAPGLGCTLKWTSPDPQPSAPDVIAIQDAWLSAVHRHPPEVASVNVQPTPCVTWTRCPATLNVPVRSGPSVGRAS